MFNLYFLQTPFQIGPFEFSLVPVYSSLDLRLLAMILSFYINAYLYQSRHFDLEKHSADYCFNRIIYVGQGFHKLEINSFFSSFFSCTFMRGNIWFLIWTFLWKTTNLKCFNCLLAISFVFIKIYFNVTVSVLTAHYWVQKSK